MYFLDISERRDVALFWTCRSQISHATLAVGPRQVRQDCLPLNEVAAPRTEWRFRNGLFEEVDEMDRRARSPHGKYCGNEVEYVLQALDSEDVRNKTSPWTQRLEAEVCRRFGVRYAIAHNSGTSA